MDRQRLHRLALEGDRDALRELVLERRRANDEDAVREVLARVGQPLSVYVGPAAAPVPTPSVLALVDALLAALEPLHQRGTAWLDLRPASIFVASHAPAAPWLEPRFEVLDLGPPLVDWPPPSGVFDTLVVPGEPRLVSPELVLGHYALDPRHDVYTVGLILYELFAGRPAWPAPVSLHTLQARTQGAPVPPGEGLAHGQRHRPIERVVMEALALPSERRFATASTFRSALAEAARQPPWRDDEAGPALPDDPLAVTLYGMIPAPPPEFVAQPVYGLPPDRGGLRGWLRRLFGR